jgi:hypothetical protein
VFPHNKSKIKRSTGSSSTTVNNSNSSSVNGSPIIFLKAATPFESCNFFLFSSSIRWADTIFVYSKTFLKEAPLMEYIGVYLYSYEAKRIANFCWAYDMRPVSFIATQSGGKNKTLLENIFTLEILK